MTGERPEGNPGARRPRARRRRAGLLVLLLPLVVAACGARLWPRGGSSDAGEHLRRAAQALHDEEFDDAAETLRALASRCENGEAGREAVLLLATLEVDPRNPTGSPDAAAQLAARYLQFPSASPASRAVAGSLYLIALDRGGSPVRDVLASIPPSSPATPTTTRRRVRRTTGPPASWSVAERFDACETGGGAIPLRPLPGHPGTPQWKVLESVRGQMEALRSDRDSLRARVDSLAGETERLPVLRQQIDSLEQELDRIRELLPTGSGSPDSPGR